MEYLQVEIADALHAAKPKRSSQTFSVRTVDGTYPVLKFWRDGLNVAEAGAPRLRGHVDILQGEDRIARCLIVFAKAEYGVATYDFKRRTDDGAQGPVDYAVEDDAPIALLT
ncbi:MAG: hypothetical protein P8I56_12880 [Paracoccaceae bacterium]|jgi:hypothetical protein|nr:hypothetical protein [Paracoccaceae bacterium]